MPPAGIVTEIWVAHGPAGLSEKRPSCEPEVSVTAIGAVVASGAPEGSKPAGVFGATTDMVVEFLAYDPATGVVTFNTSDGVTQKVVVNPAMRGFAAARRPGDRVAVQLTNALAVSIVETGG